MPADRCSFSRGKHVVPFNGLICRLPYQVSSLQLKIVSSPFRESLFAFVTGVAMVAQIMHISLGTILIDTRI